MMSTPAEQIEAMRELLHAPSRGERLWKNLSSAERKTIWSLAGLPRERFRRFWPHIPTPDQTRITQQIRKMSGWATRLQAVMDE